MEREMTFEEWCFRNAIPWPGTESQLGKCWQAAEADKAELVARLKWADELIDKAVDLMTPEQLGRWEGVRLFQQTEPEPPK